MRYTVLAASACLALAPAAAGAEVAEAAPGGFVSVHTVSVAASPAEAYAGIARIGAWWSAGHTYSGDAANLSLDPRAGGCFCEAMPDGGSVEHMRVVQARPGALLRLAGGLGPLQADPVAAVLSFALTPQEGGGTRIAVSYRVAGPMQMGGERLAPLVDAVLAEQVTRLAQLLSR
jgi:uncharacterized protein YndB with AHSA1/START domain